MFVFTYCSKSLYHPTRQRSHVSSSYHQFARPATFLDCREKYIFIRFFSSSLELNVVVCTQGHKSDERQGKERLLQLTLMVPFSGQYILQASIL